MQYADLERFMRAYILNQTYIEGYFHGELQEVQYYSRNLYPFGVFIVPTLSGEYTSAAYRQTKTYNCTVIFYDRRDFDFNQANFLELRSRLDAYSDSFIEELNNCNILMTVGNVQRTYSNLKDSNQILLGVVTNFSLTVPNDFDFCANINCL